MHGRGEKVYKVLAGKPERKRPLGRPKCRWKDEIRMGNWLWYGVESSVSGYEPVAGCCECDDEPFGSGAAELVISSK
jgi:hypothetical protein